MFRYIWISALLFVLQGSFVFAGKFADQDIFFLNDSTKTAKDSTQKPANNDTLNSDPRDEDMIGGYRINKVLLNMQAYEFVEDYIERYASTLHNVKEQRKPYFEMIDDVLVQHGLPKELKYLAVIESYLNPNARSASGAVGVWQFMTGTARNMGLRVSGKVDERKNVYKSTHAACRYLTTLYGMYGDWLLVVAAYNSGPGYVNNAIKKTGSADFWEIQNYLPAQSRNHVKKYIATHFLLEGCGSITTLTKKEAANLLLNPSLAITKEELDNSITQQIRGRYNASVIAKHLAMEMADFYRINPDFDKTIADIGAYEIRLPINKMDIFLRKKNEILVESVQQLLDPDNKTTQENGQPSSSAGL